MDVSFPPSSSRLARLVCEKFKLILLNVDLCEGEALSNTSSNIVVVARNFPSAARSVPLYGGTGGPSNETDFL